MHPTFDQVSDRIARIVGPAHSPGRWRLISGRIHADCSAGPVIVRIGAPDETWTVMEIASESDLDLLAATVVGFVAAQCVVAQPERGHDRTAAA